MKKKANRFSERLCLVAAFSGLLLPGVAQGANATFYGIAKSQAYQQTGASTVTPAAADPYTLNAFAVPSAPNSISLAILETPDSEEPLFLADTGGRFTVSRSFATEAALEAAFPAGDYTLMIISMPPGLEAPPVFTFESPQYPPTPQISNFSAAQAIDGTKDFVLTWNAFAGATEKDFIKLTITDNAGAVVFETGDPGESDVLAASAQSVAIPANKLGTGTFNAALSFHHVFAEDTTSYAGALGIASFSKTTSFTMKAAGGVDTVAPSLVSSNPENGAKGVALDVPVTFAFSEAMAASQSITWSANLVPAQFAYAWSGDSRTLTCTYGGTFPPNSTIQWTLVPNGFKDVAGNPLSSANLSGNFMTGTNLANVDDPCSTNSTDDGSGVLSMFKSVQYVQTSNAAPVLDPDTGPTFAASLTSPTNNPVREATLTLPNGSSRILTNFFGRTFFLFDEFATAEQLDAAYPAGTYTVNMKRVTGTATLALDISAAAPPVPQLSNLEQTKAFDPTADFNIQWLPFTGVTENDTLFLSLYDNLGTNFHAPDFCIPRPLANTATSIVLPKMTFATGTTIDGSLSFSKTKGVNTNSVPGIPAYAGYTKTTNFKFQNAGSEPERPVIQNLVRAQNGLIQFQVKAKVGAVLSVEASENLEDWVPVTTGVVPASGVLDVTDPLSTSLSQRFYRVSTF